jgi:addiction module RelE/StbE family toxin
VSSQIIWSPGAAQDIERLRKFIQQKNPSAAKRAANRILEASKILKANPEAGYPLEDYVPYRQLTIPFGDGDYIIRYRLEENKVFIARVWHSKEHR